MHMWRKFSLLAKDSQLGAFELSTLYTAVLSNVKVKNKHNDQYARLKYDLNKRHGCVTQAEFYRRARQGLDWKTVCCEMGLGRTPSEFTGPRKWKSAPASRALFKQMGCGKADLPTSLRGPCSFASWNVCTTSKTGPNQVYFRTKYWLENNILVTSLKWTISVIKCNSWWALCFEPILILSRHFILNGKMHDCA